MSAPRRKATYDDLCAVPEWKVAEIIDGELITSPRPAPRHALATSAIGAQLFNPFNKPPGDRGRPGGWWILYEPELHLGEDVLVPDVAGWQRERMPTLGKAVGMTIAPDWVCEVLSPSTRALDRRRKMPIYAREKVEWLWLVDPLARRLEIHRHSDRSWQVAGTHEADERVHVPPFDAVELDLGEWWHDS